MLCDRLHVGLVFVIDGGVKCDPGDLRPSKRFLSIGRECQATGAASLRDQVFQAWFEDRRMTGRQVRYSMGIGIASDCGELLCNTTGGHTPEVPEAVHTNPHGERP